MQRTSRASAIGLIRPSSIWQSFLCRDRRNRFWSPVYGVSLASMKHVKKETTDDALIQEYLNKGGKVSVGKTKPPKAELGLSNNQWNNNLTKEEKAARDKK